MAWLTGSLTDNGWLTGAVSGSVNNLNIILTGANIVVDIFGQPVTHTFNYWFITQDDVDANNYNGLAINVVDKGTDLEVIDGEATIYVGSATAGQTYKLIAFDSDESNYFRYEGIAEVV